MDSPDPPKSVQNTLIAMCGQQYRDNRFVYGYEILPLNRALIVNVLSRVAIAIMGTFWSMTLAFIMPQVSIYFVLALWKGQGMRSVL